MRLVLVAACASMLVACTGGGGVTGVYTAETPGSGIAKIELKSENKVVMTLDAGQVTGEAANAPAQEFTYTQPTASVVVIAMGGMTAEYMLDANCLVAPNGMKWCRH